jgi:twinkle protein
MMIDLECDQDSIYTEQKNFVKELIRFASKFNSVVHLVAHPRKVETIRRLTKMDVCGSGDITNLAHYVVSIHRVTDHEKEGVLDKKGNWVMPPVKYDCLIDLFKNRIMGYQDKTIGVHYDIPSKRFYGDSDDIDRQYSWDKTPYDEKNFQFKAVENTDSPF